MNTNSLNLQTQDESVLAEELRAGNSSVYERLYHEQSSRMKSIAANLLGNRNDAEDAVHDTFVKVFQARMTFDGRCPVRYWMMRILVNTCHDRLRTRRRVEPVPETITSRRDDHILRASLEKAVQQLSIRQRTVFLLYDVEGLRHAEIAAVMEEPEGTVRGLLFEARKTLRAILRPLEARA